MKLRQQVTIGVLVAACVMHAAAAGRSREFTAQSTSEHGYLDDRIAGPTDHRAVLRFLECQGNLSILLLENHASQPLYVRFETAPDVPAWSEYRQAKAVLGVHFIGYRAPGSQHYADQSAAWDAPPDFRKVRPGGSIRYGVPLTELGAEQGGEYRVGVPAMYDKAAVDLLEKEFDELTPDDEKHIDAAWFDVWSAPIEHPCHQNAAN